MNRLLAYANTRRERRRNTERRVTTNVSMFNLLFVGNRAVNGAAIASEGAVRREQRHGS